MPAGKWSVGTVRIECERDCDSKRAGGIGYAGEWASSDLFVDVRAVCGSDAEWRHGKRVGDTGSEPEYRAAVRDAVQREQY